MHALKVNLRSVSLSKKLIGKAFILKPWLLSYLLITLKNSI